MTNLHFYNLKGMWGLLVASADITSPSADRDRLIFWVSLSRSPCTSVFATLSLPARSTNHSLLLVHSPFNKFSPFTITQWMLCIKQRNRQTLSNLSKDTKHDMIQNVRFLEKKMKRDQWDLLLCSFALVDPTALALLPVWRTSQTSFMLLTCASTSPGTWCIPSPTCLISSLQVIA